MKQQCKNLIFLLLIHTFSLYSSSHTPIVLTGEKNQSSLEDMKTRVLNYLNPPTADPGPPLCAFSINVWEIQNPVYYNHCRVQSQSLMHTTCAPLREFFEYIIGPYINIITTQNHYCMIPGYLPNSLRDGINNLSQFSHLDEFTVNHLKKRLESYCCRIENLLYNRKGFFCNPIASRDQIKLIHIYADFLKEFYCHQGQFLFHEQAKKHPAMEQVMPTINWNWYDDADYTDWQSTKELRYAKSINGNLGKVYAALHKGEHEKAYTIGQERVKTKYCGCVYGSTTEVTSVFEEYPNLKKIVEERYLADKAKAEQERAAKQVIKQKNAIKWCQSYKDINPYLPQYLLQQRHKAANRSKNGKIYNQAYTLSSKQAQHIDEQFLDKDKKSITLDGSYLQHQLLNESIIVIDTVIDPRTPTKRLKDAIVGLANASLFSNKKDDVLTTTHMLDACWALIDLDKEIAQGMYEGVCESLVGAGFFIGKSIHTFVEYEAAGDLCETDFFAGKAAIEKLSQNNEPGICHAVAQVARSIGNVIYTLNALEAAVELCDSHPEIGREIVKKVQEESSLPALWEYAQTLSAKDIARGSTKFIVDACLFHKATQMVSLLGSKSTLPFLYSVRTGIEAGKTPITAELVFKEVIEAETVANSIFREVIDAEIVVNSVQTVGGSATITNALVPVTNAVPTLAIPAKLAVPAKGFSICAHEAKDLSLLTGPAEIVTNSIKNAPTVASYTPVTNAIVPFVKKVNLPAVIQSTKNVQKVCSGGATVAETIVSTTKKSSAITVAAEEFSTGVAKSKALVSSVENTQKIFHAEIVEPTKSFIPTKSLTPIKKEVQKLIDTFNIAHYDPYIGNLQIFPQAFKELRNVSGALVPGSALCKALDTGKKVEFLNRIKTATQMDGRLETARGALYEVEETLNLMKKGEQISKVGERFPKIGQKILKPGDPYVEFDISTPTKLIECKNLNWGNKPIDKLKEVIDKLCEQKEIADINGKIFELHSKQAIPAHIKELLYEKGINFIEDIS